METEGDARKLIALVKAKPKLYNNTSGINCNRIAKDRMWKEIASEMGFSESLCRRQWSSFRSCYSRFRREQRENIIKRKTWYLMEDLSFLNEYIHTQRRRTRYTLESSSIHTDSNSNGTPPPVKQLNSSAESEQPSPFIPAGESTLKVNPVPIITIDDDVEDEPKLQPNPIIPGEDPGRNLIPDSNNYTQTFLINEIASPTVDSNEKTTDDQANSSNRLFLQSLLLDMNKLSERKQRVFKRKTLELMEDLFDSNSS